MKRKWQEHEKFMSNELDFCFSWLYCQALPRREEKKTRIWEVDFCFTWLYCQSSSALALSTALQNTCLNTHFNWIIKIPAKNLTKFFFWFIKIIPKCMPKNNSKIIWLKHSLKVMVNFSSSMLITSLSSKLVWTWTSQVYLWVILKYLREAQSPKKSQLSGRRTVTRKNFPDEVSKFFPRHVS